jgi:hypothetical protein
LKPFLFVATILTIALPAAAANVTFNASGTFSDGSILGGTLTIDTTVGNIVGSDLITTGPSSFTFVNLVNQSFTQVPGDYNVGDRNSDSTEDFDFDLPDPGQTPLVGYNGGSICSASALCVPGRVGNLFNLALNQGGPFLLSGSLSPAVPEPTPTALISLGLFGLGALGFRRRRNC